MNAEGKNIPLFLCLLREQKAMAGCSPVYPKKQKESAELKVEKKGKIKQGKKIEN